MEKIVWVRSRGKDDGLTEVNQLLQQGWRVKSMAACPTGFDDAWCAQAYVVLEKHPVPAKGGQPKAVPL